MSTENQSSPITSAWRWSVERSPLLNVSRWILHRGYPNAKARKLIDHARLPDQLASLIDSTVSRTRLWSSERAEIAKELIAHTQDALEAGRSPEQITESFGDPKRVAKLLRRSTKRKRPLYWRTLRNARRATTVVFGLLFVVYVVQGIRYFSGEPNITTNYPAMINAKNDAYSEDQKAWPIIHEVDLEWKRHTLEARERQKSEIVAINDSLDESQELWDRGLDSLNKITPKHPQYDETVQIVRDFEPQLALLRDAVRRPVLGIDLGFDAEAIEVEGGVYDSVSTPPHKDPAMNGTMIELLLPHLSTMRKLTNILDFDTDIAARESDAQRVYENFSAMLALAKHRSFDQTIITDLVGIAIAEMTSKSITEVIQQYPGLLDREQLIKLSHELASVRPTLEMSFEGEIMMFDDFIQRTYTDDGNGNGRLTRHGMQLLLSVSGGYMDPEFMGTTPTQIITGPIALTIAHDRLSQTTRYYAMMDTMKDVQRLGPQYLPLLDAQERTLETEATTIEGLRYSPVDLLMPALGRAVERTFLSQMTNDATTAMLALEIYKLDTGSYPATLAQLPLNYLPAIPMDLFHPGQPLIYKSTDNGGYMLYSVGSNGVDDDAAPYSETFRRYTPTFRDRFRPEYNSDDQLVFDPSGVPVTKPRTEPHGDWILIEMTPHEPRAKQEPDQSPALESIN